MRLLPLLLLLCACGRSNEDNIKAYKACEAAGMYARTYRSSVDNGPIVLCETPVKQPDADPEAK
jgi:hypothetical protein